ncbi:MAG: hypothetical protein M3Y09_09175 [Actinomycetota bacterium]|nr:hypothetical protein [Actinomycetota bacterium]
MSARESTAFDLERPKSVGELISDAVRCYGLYPSLFAQITLAVVVPYALIVLLIDGRGLLSQGSGSASAALLVLVLDLLLVGPLISALHVNAVVEIGGRRRPQVNAVLTRGARVLPVVAAAQIVAALGTGLGFILLIVPGVLLLARWAVVAQTAALENVTWIGALRRSGELTAGCYLHVLGLVISVGVINVVIVRVGTALSGSGSGGSAVAVILGILFEMITLSFSALCSAMLYFDLRARKRAPSVAGEV